MKIDNVDILSLNLDASKSAMLNDNFTRSLNLAPPYLDASTIVGPVESIIEQVKGVVDAFATTALSALQMIDNIFDVVLKGIGKIIELLNSVIKIVTGLFRPHKWMSTIIDGLTSACEWLTKVRSQFSNKTAGITTKIGEIQTVCKDAIEDGKKIFIKKVNKILKVASEWLKVVFDWIKKQLSSFEKWLKGLAISGIEKLQKKKEERLKKEAEDRLLAAKESEENKDIKPPTQNTSNNPAISAAISTAISNQQKSNATLSAQQQAAQQAEQEATLTKDAAISAGWKEVKTVTYEFSSACSEQIKIDFSKIQWKYDTQSADSTTYSSSSESSGATSGGVKAVSLVTDSSGNGQLTHSKFREIKDKVLQTNVNYDINGGGDPTKSGARVSCSSFTRWVCNHAFDINIENTTFGQWRNFTSNGKIYTCKQVSVDPENNKTQLRDGDLIIWGRPSLGSGQAGTKSSRIVDRKYWEVHGNRELYIGHVSLYVHPNKFLHISSSKSQNVVVDNVKKYLNGSTFGDLQILGIGRWNNLSGYTSDGVALTPTATSIPAAATTYGSGSSSTTVNPSTISTSLQSRIDAVNREFDAKNFESPAAARLTKTENGKKIYCSVCGMMSGGYNRQTGSIKTSAGNTYAAFDHRIDNLATWFAYINALRTGGLKRDGKSHWDKCTTVYQIWKKYYTPDVTQNSPYMNSLAKTIGRSVTDTLPEKVDNAHSPELWKKLCKACVQYECGKDTSTKRAIVVKTEWLDVAWEMYLSDPKLYKGKTW